METRNLGTSGLKVSAVGLGCKWLKKPGWLSVPRNVALDEVGSYQDGLDSHRSGWSRPGSRALTVTEPSLSTVTMLDCQ